MAAQAYSIAASHIVMATLDNLEKTATEETEFMLQVDYAFDLSNGTTLNIAKKW